MEQWRPIKGFEGLYEVSNKGRVRSFYTREAKVLKPSINKDGYLKAGLSKDGKMYLKSIHRLVASAFIPNIGDKPQVNHIDGDKTNNTVDNLEWVTCKENIQHAWNTGLSRMTKERKKKLSESHKGKLAGEKNPMYGRTGEKNPMYGKHHTEETKRKMSKMCKDKYKGEKNPRARKVICTNTGEIFNYIREGAKKYNVANPSISACCKGKRKSAGKHPATGEKLVWRYAENLKEKIK